MSARVPDSPHWSLFADWCTATGRVSLPAPFLTVAEFLAQCPSSAGVAKTRMREIARVHDAAGYALRVPPPVLVGATAFRHGPVPGLGERPDGTVPVWLSLEETLRSLPVYGDPHGVAGRRDGFIVVAVGVLGLSLGRAARLTPSAVSIDGSVVRIAGCLVPVADDPASCPRCAVTRWLRVLSAWYEQWFEKSIGAVEAAVSRRVPSHVHDCMVPVPTGWGEAQVLVPSVDRGRLYPFRLSSATPHALRSVLSRRQHPHVLTVASLSGTRAADVPVAVEVDAPAAEPVPDVPVFSRPAGHRLNRDEHDELDDLFADLDARTEVLMAAVEQVLVDNGVKPPKRRRPASA